MTSAPIQIELPTPFAVGPVNCFLLLDPEPTLIDCGMKIEMSQTALINGLAKHGLTVADLKHIVITHAHVDHMGLTGWLCERSDAQVWVSDLVEPWALDLHGMWQQRLDMLPPLLTKLGLDEAMQMRVTAYMKAVPSTWDNIPAERLTVFDHVNGQLQMGGKPWDVLYLPGHTTHQTGFYQPDQGWLLSADCLLHRTPVPVLETDPKNRTERSVGFPIHVQSIERLRKLEVSVAYPGHGGPIDNHQAMITKQLARIATRKAECYSLILAGNHTLPIITELMYGHYPPAARFTGLSTIVGYTDLLIAEGKIDRVEQDGVWQFVPR